MYGNFFRLRRLLSLSAVLQLANYKYWVVVRELIYDNACGANLVNVIGMDVINAGFDAMRHMMGWNRYGWSESTAKGDFLISVF